MTPRLARVLAINQRNEIVPIVQPQAYVDIPVQKKCLTYGDFVEMSEWLGKTPTADEWLEYNDALNDEGTKQKQGNV